MTPNNLVIEQKTIGRTIIPHLDVPRPMPPVSTGSAYSPKNRPAQSIISLSEGRFF